MWKQTEDATLRAWLCMSRNKEGKENNDGDEEGEVDGVVEEDQGEENVVEDKNCLMDFVLQLEYVADEDDNTDIQRMWKKELGHVNALS